MAKKTKICRTCGAEVEKKATKCPECYLIFEEKPAKKILEAEEPLQEWSLQKTVYEDDNLTRYEMFDFTGTMTYTLTFTESRFSFQATMEPFMDKELPSFLIKSNFFKNKFTISCPDDESFEEAKISFPFRKSKGSFKLKQGKQSFKVWDPFSPPLKKVQVMETSHKRLAVEFEKPFDDLIQIKTTQIIDALIWEAVAVLLLLRF